jgi:hypothetical protein
MRRRDPDPIKTRLRWIAGALAVACAVGLFLLWLMR